MAEGDVTAFPEEEQSTLGETPLLQPTLPSPPCLPALPRVLYVLDPGGRALRVAGSRGGSVLWGQVRVNVGPKVEGFPQRREGRWPGLRSRDVRRSQEPTLPLPLPPWALFLVAGCGMVSLLLCGVSIALPLFIRADECQNVSVQNEAPLVSQPFAFNCTYPPLTSGKAYVTWYKHPSKIPVSKYIWSRIHQDQNWILFLPLTWEDSGIYQCVINNTNTCHQIQVNLTVFEKHSCDTSRNSQMNLSDEYRQILHIGKDDSLMCHLNFPKSCDLDSVKWYKDCKEIKGERFTNWGIKLSVNNVSAEDRGNYTCQARLIHAGREFTVLNKITVDTRENVGHRGRIPKIIYPINNTIEVQLGSRLVVNCNITDTTDNTNLRCWRVNGTLVDTYYEESKRIQEGIEIPTSFPEYKFYTVDITFLEVKMEDYGHPFTCHAGVSAAYFMLQPPVPDFRAYLIGGLVAFTSVAVFITCIYNIFKIDITLWYRSAFHSTGTMDDKGNIERKTF